MSERTHSVVVGATPGPGWELALGLSEHVNVAFVSLGGELPPTDRPDRLTVAGSWDGLSATGLAELQLSHNRSSPVAAIWAVTAPHSGDGIPFASFDDAMWSAQAEAPITQFRRFLQGMIKIFGDSDGTIIALIPSSGLTGAPPGYVAWTTAAEGQRALVRIAARSWGAQGVRVHSVGVTPDLLVGNASSPDSRGTDSPRMRPGLRPRSIGRRPTVRDDVATVVRALIGPEWRSVNGMTLNVDGGVWMTP